MHLKNWYTLIKNSSFIREHLNFSKNNPPQLLIYDYGAPGDFPPITFISDYGIDAPTHEVNPQSFEGMTNLLGSIDGLFFLEREINNDVLCALWNPATREVRDLLSAVGIKFESFFSSDRFFGFGLDVLTTNYKVVYYNCKNENAVVYSCSRDSWRIFKHENVCDNRNAECVDTFYGSTTYLNGSYYWMLRKNVNFNFTFKFLSFNFGNEVFEVIEGPPHDCAIRSWTADLMILDDSIAILNEVDMFIYNVWALELQRNREMKRERERERSRFGEVNGERQVVVITQATFICKLLFGLLHWCFHLEVTHGGPQNTQGSRG
ncbi:uncharacterized protein [Solanum tuberosum]|uniref:uncharacterized protein n=1 Tax=Solanum tuberosum TaxID=4113 RepID=UPI00073A12BB|nr:PREDICTED: uncharacterized protein LOC107062174 [Solanum tuberosum]